MNKDRRMKINNVSQKLKKLLNDLESIKSEEEDSFDSMPENLQGSLRGEESQDAISSMEDAIDSLNEALDIIDLIY